MRRENSTKPPKIHSKSEENLPPKYQDVFGLTVLDLARKNKRIVGITPAMPSGSSLKFMMDELPERAFDVGIAEQHAVTLAAGMATQGMVVSATSIRRSCSAYDRSSMMWP
jgi:1-deoxy-D-xylulose-5-phosphate synthase